MSGWVLVTRPADRTGELSAALAAHGLRVVPYPTLREVPFEDLPGWREAASRLGEVAWLVFTSPRAAGNFVRQAGARGLAEQLASLPVAAVGEATARAARAAGCAVRLVGSAGGAELARRLLDILPAGAGLLHPCGRERRPELEDALAAGGMQVLRLVVYGTEVTPARELPALPEEPPFAVVLSSPRATRGYFQACGNRFLGIPHLAFGAATAEESARHGVPALALARPTAADIVEELCPTS